MRKEVLVVLILALLCGFALAAKGTKRAHKRYAAQEQQQQLVKKAVREAAPVPVESVDAPEYYYGDINLYSVYPQLVPAGYSNFSLTGYSTSYLPQSYPLCCVFGSASYSSNATNYGYSIFCPIPSLAYSGEVTNAYLAYCSDLDYAISNTFVVVVYNGLPTISSVQHASNLYAIGGQNVTIELGNMPPGNFYTYSVRPVSGYTWTTYTVDANTVIGTSGAVPIGNDQIYVQLSFNSSYISTTTYSINFKSVRIQDYSPSSGCVIGYTNITLDLDVPPPDNGYYFSLPECHFTPDYYDISAIRVNAHQVSPVQYDAASNAFYCLSPSWGYAESSATLTLVDPYELSSISNPISFEYMTQCLNNLDNNDFCAIGNVPVFINGEGLPDTSTYAYAYVYYDPEMTYLLYSSTFYFLNSSTGYYLTSTAQYEYPTTYVKISTYSFVISTNFTVQTTNSCISYVSPKSVSIAGGVSVTLTFNTNMFTTTNSYSSYHCLFIDPENYHLPQPATIISPDQVTCVAPPVSEKGTGSVSFAVSLTYPYNEFRTTSPVTIQYH